MYILLDIGNTRLKASTADSNSIYPNENWLDFTDIAEEILISNVAGSDALPKELARSPKCKFLTWQSP